jgi:hypothetical protein
VAYADFDSLTGLIRACLTSDGGPSPRSSADGTATTGYIDSTGTADATLAGTAPQINSPVGLEGPTAYHGAAVAETGESNGYNFGAVISGLTVWTFACTVRARALDAFRNLLSSQGGASEGSLYCNGGLLTYQEASTESTGTTLLVDTIYRVILTSDGTNYRVYIDGVLVYTSTMAVITAPTAAETGAYGGSGAPWAGDWWAIVFYNTAVSGADIATLDAALLEEAEGASTTNVTVAGDLAGLAASATAETIAAATGAGDLPGLSAAATISTSAGLTVDGALPGLSAVATATAVPSVSIAADLPGLASSATMVATASRNVGIAASLPGLSSAGLIVDLNDTFETGPKTLDGWVAYNAAAIPTVQEVDERYRALVSDNTADITLWLDNAAGRGDYLEIPRGTRLIFRNIGIGTPADSQATPPVVGDPYNFSGPQLNGDPWGSPASQSQHVVVGYRGNTTFGDGRTIEGKTTVAGSSSINSLASTLGDDALVGTRADILLDFKDDGTTEWSWQEPNLTGDASLDSFTVYAMPGPAQTFGPTAFVGIISYAFGTDGLPFVGTCDAVELSNPGIAVNASFAGLASTAAVQALAAATVAGQLAGLAGSASLELLAAVAADGRLPGLAGSGALEAVGAVAATADLPGLAASAGLDVEGQDVVVSGSLPGLAILASLDADVAVTVAGALPGLQSVATVGVEASVAVAGAFAGLASTARFGDPWAAGEGTLYLSLVPLDHPQVELTPAPLEHVIVLPIIPR